MDVNVIDDFLSQEEFEEVRDLIVFNWDFDWYFQKEVNAAGTDCTKDFWNWYGTHIFYKKIFLPMIVIYYMINLSLVLKRWGSFVPL